MTKYRFLALLLLLIPISCQTGPPSGGGDNIAISEIIVGEVGNNNHEFIELYNPNQSPIDLDGFSLWYRLPTSDEDLLIYEWAQESMIPGQGHYLLAREGEDFGILPNRLFSQSMNTNAGGVVLRDPTGASVDAVGWGQAIPGFSEGSPVLELENGSSLERLPGGEMGNHTDTDNNLKDFVISSAPHPQNTGSPLTPSGDLDLALGLHGPEVVEPGSQFAYDLKIENTGTDTYQGITVELLLPGELETPELPSGVTREEEKISWEVGELAPGGSRSQTLQISAPWMYLDFLLDQAFARTLESKTVVFAPPIQMSIEGGVIPISTARGLAGAELTVEGIATMYTGGYFAGSGNVKFFIEDETGGVQVQVFDGEGQVSVPIGARVRVHGMMDVYRDAMELIPISVPEDVEIIRTGEATDYAPLEVDIRQAVNDFETLPGRLIRVGGTITRVEEFNYNFDIDLTDESGNTLRVYVDKLTEMTVETLETGHFFTATGILEVQDGHLDLYPRLPSDLQEVFPPVLMVHTEASNTILPGETFEVSLIATNHSSQPLGEILLSASIPADLVEVSAVHDDGVIQDDQIIWNIDSLGANGETANVTFDLTVLVEGGQIPVEGHAVLVNQEIDVIERDPWHVFVGTSLPIWAIQGTTSRSPYVLDEVYTSGVVTGVFPELGGFWIQSAIGDGDPLTSDGLFVFIDELEFPYSIGDTVGATGQVREISQQTLMQVPYLYNLELLEGTSTEIAPIELDPPVDDGESQRYFETLEGMLVQVSDPALAVSPTSRYGEYALVRQSHGIERVWQGSPAGEVIMVDDGSEEVHDNRSTLEYVVKTGDQVSELIGPLAFTFGRYKIEPIFAPHISPAIVTPEVFAETGEDEFTVMTWNVENLFDILAPHPADPPLPRKAEYELTLTKIANTIQAAGFPILIGLQEVENVGILEDLASQPILEPYHYASILIEGTDNRGIDVGYLIRTDRAQVLDQRQFPAPEGLTSRPPLMVEISVHTSHGDVTIYALNNHFTSMAAGVAATEPRRAAQAAWNVEIYQALLGEAPDAQLLVLGDLNSYFASAPIEVLRDAGFQHVFDTLEADQRYTYIFEGASQTLDHILVTPNLMAMLKTVEVLHTNSDFPPPSPDDPSPMHESDHDPVIARFVVTS